MLRSEWIEAVALMRLNWPHVAVDEAVAGKWFSDLEHLPAEQVKVAIEALYRDGREFPPNGAQILAKVSALGRDDVDHGEAWVLMNKALMRYGVSDWDKFYECLPPAVAEAARRMHFELNNGYLKAEESTIRAQFRDIYKSVVAERKRDDAYAGLPNAGLRGLERGPRKLGDALKHALPERAS